MPMALQVTLLVTSLVTLHDLHHLRVFLLVVVVPITKTFIFQVKVETLTGDGTVIPEWLRLNTDWLVTLLLREQQALLLLLLVVTDTGVVPQEHLVHMYVMV
jgi:hypothetical protein